MRFVRCYVPALVLLTLLLPVASQCGEYAIPKLPDGLVGAVVVKFPDTADTESVAVSADGRKVYIGEQPSANGKGKWGHVKLAYDADGDGVYERLTVFAKETNGAQGMLCVDDTLYLVHSPLLTSLRDLDGDGVAEERKDLVEGLGPKFNGGLHDHTSSGLALAVDGWLYISIGDQAVHSAKGTDGKTVQLYGGGVIRVRPDGTDIEVYCLGLRNTMDVSVDPELNVFTRDNTNDGGGWNVRSTHILQSAQFGYPNLFKNYVEETIPCMDDHGGGSGTGGVFYAEAGLREEDRYKAFITDWGRATIYRYELTRKGATFAMKQTDWFKAQSPFRGIDVQPDAYGNMYVADWGQGGWGKPAPVGAIIKISAANAPLDRKLLESFSQVGSIIKPLPKIAEMNTAGLVEVLGGTSHILRIQAQKYLLKQGEVALPELRKAIEGPFLKDGPLVPGMREERLRRIAALWAYKQIAREKAIPLLVKVAETHPDVRDHALRALTDRKGELAGVPLEPFVKAIQDKDPFVRTQAAICLGRLGKKEGADALCLALGDAEVQVRHVAMQSLRLLSAHEACLKTAESDAGVAGQMALVALREIYTDEAADGLIALSKKIAADKKPDVLKAIGRLAKKEDEWTGKWWGTQPNTLGPFQKPASWKNTDKLLAVLKVALKDKDEPVVAAALWGLACARDASSASEVLKLAEDSRASVKAAAIKMLMASKAPEAVPLFAKLLLDPTAPEDQRKAALDALDKMKPASEKAIAEAIASLDREFKDKKFDKNNGLLPKARKALADAKSDSAVPVLKTLIVNAELSDDTRVGAAQALAAGKSPAAAEALASLLSEKNPDLVSLALRSLDPKGGVKAEKVRPFLKADDAKVKGAAFVALGRLKDEASAEIIATHLKNQALQPAAIEALAAMGPAGGALTILDTAERLLALVDLDECATEKLEQQAVACARVWIASPALSAEQRKPLETRMSSRGGIVSTWQLLGPFRGVQGNGIEIEFDVQEAKPEDIAKFKVKWGSDTLEFKPYTTSDPEGKVEFNKVWEGDASGAVAFGYTEIVAPAEGKANFAFGSDDALQVFVNGARVHEFRGDRGLNPESDKFSATLKAGKNVVLAKVINNGGPWGLAGRIELPAAKRDKSKRVQQREALIADALARTGDAAKGEALFLDEKRANCVKCHQVHAKGGNIGPDLSSIGATKEKRYLIDSVLEPAKDIAQGFQTMRIVLDNGKMLFGVPLNQTAGNFELATTDGKRETIAEKDVKSKTPVPQSIMPEGQADMYTRDEFVDLIAYLASLKK